MARSNKRFDCQFGDYDGSIRWLVTHPKYQDCVAKAPDDYAAIKAVADWWGEDWLRYGFYTKCKVTKV